MTGKIKNIFLIVLALSFVFASEDMLEDPYPQKKSHLTQEEVDLLQQSLDEHYKQEEKYKQSQDRILKGLQESKSKQTQSLESIQNTQKAKLDNLNDILNKNSTSLGSSSKTNKDPKLDTMRNSQKDTKSIDDKENNPYLGLLKQNGQKDKEVQIVKNQKWIYGVSVITTIFLDGSIKRSYGVLLKDGLFLTSANMVYDKNIYPRESYAMMQDDSSIPFICVAKLSIKALDLQRGLAILETSSYTDMYCNPREKSFYHQRIYSDHWINIFEKDPQVRHGIVYSPYISDLNSFYTRKSPVEDSLEVLAKEESHDFQGYKYAYGKSYFTVDGKLIGVVGASKDEEPKLLKREEITEFLCELKERKILQNSYLQNFCSSIKKQEN